MLPWKSQLYTLRISFQMFLLLYENHRHRRSQNFFDICVVKCKFWQVFPSRTFLWYFRRWMKSLCCRKFHVWNGNGKLCGKAHRGWRVRGYRRRMLTENPLMSSQVGELCEKLSLPSSEHRHRHTIESLDFNDKTYRNQTQASSQSVASFFIHVEEIRERKFHRLWLFPFVLSNGKFDLIKQMKTNLSESENRVKLSCRKHKRTVKCKQKQWIHFWIECDRISCRYDECI
jgi:hypothetical protein